MFRLDWSRNKTHSNPLFSSQGGGKEERRDDTCLQLVLIVCSRNAGKESCQASGGPDSKDLTCQGSDVEKMSQTHVSTTHKLQPMLMGIPLFRTYSGTK